jgi:ppGpp synthetase/RelA/SpoT-type nucleotidyltranferase
MTVPALTAQQDEQIAQLVALYMSPREQERFEYFLNGLRGLVVMQPLSGLVHSFKARLKDPEHLRDKLRRKMVTSVAENAPFDITPENLFQKINDLVGLRILHLYTRQLREINTHLIETLKEQEFPLVEGPFARTWDDESRAYFQSLGIETRGSDSMYTSVHYIVEANRKTKRTGEIQVRTLAEELWGEVDHTINYPTPSPRMTCKEQIRVLARATSTCTRLVDSIFAAHNEGPHQP